MRSHWFLAHVLGSRGAILSLAPEGAPLLPFGLNKLSVRLLLLVLLTAVPVFAVEAYYELQLREQHRDRPAGATDG